MKHLTFPKLGYLPNWCLWTVIAFSTIAVNAQNDSINNLKQPSWYEPVDLGSIGEVVKIGHGKQDLILVTGTGFGASVFFDFMMRNKENYTLHAFTEAGAGTTIAPPIPENQNYGERIWSVAFENAVVDYIQKNDMNNVTVLGFFSGGVQHGIRIATKAKDRTKNLVLVSGELYRIGEESMNITKEVRVKGIKAVANGWFKTVTQKTWYEGMYEPAFFSTDSIQSERYVDMQNLPLIPNAVQYLLEFMVDDPTEELLGLDVPILVVLPSFTKEYLSVKGNDFIENTFVNEWYKFQEKYQKEDLKIEKIGNSQIAVFHDKPEEFEGILGRFIQN